MGIQGHSTDDLRTVCEWVWDGAIGEIREVDAWCSLTYYPWGHAGWSSQWGERPKETPPVPDTLNWDLWLGPARERPYHRAYHPATWRCWWDFGCGMMGDRGAHTLDVVNWALKLGPPSSIEATSCGMTAEVHPLSAIVTFRFPARENLPPLKLTWYEGTRPSRPEDMDEDVAWPGEGGVLFKGTKGIILSGVYSESPKLLPLSLHLDYKRPPKSLPRVADHSHELDWIRAIKNGGKAGASFEYSGPLTETCLLGNVAKRVDGRITWDAQNLKTNSEAANRLIKTEYRAGWSL
jgi:predicted dehydrogenase